VADIFGEVDEQLRAERLRTFLRTAVPMFIATAVLCVIAVVAVWGVQKYQSDQSAKASEAYQTALDVATKGGDQAKAYDQFAEVAKGSGPFKSLALMQQGAIRMEQGKPADAAALFDQAAAASKDPLVVDSAILKSVYAVMDTAPVDQMVAKLKPLTDPKRPFHALAREATAMAYLAAGKTVDAKAEMVALSLLQDTPDSARQRAQAVISLIDSGSGAGMRKLVEQSKTATPTPPAPPAGQAPPQPGGGIQVQSEAPQ
jgi:hypothetical protein